MKHFLTGFFCCYLICGAYIGLGMRRLVPPTTYFGVAYMAVIWPAWLAQPWTGWEPPVPRQSFSFDKH